MRAEPAETRRRSFKLGGLKTRDLFQDPRTDTFLLRDTTCVFFLQTIMNCNSCCLYVFIIFHPCSILEKSSQFAAPSFEMATPRYFEGSDLR
jgi:hypothetical protein